MTRFLRASAAATLLLGGAACSDFLAGDKLDSDPNRATSAQAAQLFTSMQVNSYYVLSGHAARILAMWAQQMAGTDRQYIGYDQYSVTEGLFTEFTNMYTGGGLTDIRTIQTAALADGNKTMAGIAKVWEALVVGFVADNYGDIPYSEAVRPDEFPTPKLDKQADVYAALQTLLDGAIADLSANAGSVGALDLSLGGSNAAWIKVARSLKARLYMHVAETATANYALALAQAQQGINTTDGSLNEYHSASSGEENIWWQFIARDRDSYIRPGKNLVDLMMARSDPRVPDYFAENDQGGYGGAEPGELLDGDKHSNLGPGRLFEAFAQPIISWEETQGIIAEAAYRTGNETLARQAMNALRTAGGLPAINGQTGSVLLKQIMEEKYVATFQSPEVMNDYKRTCYPNITPATNASAAGIPARFTYPIGERTANPNIPAPGAQPRRNTNDPANASSVDGTACKGQK